MRKSDPGFHALRLRKEASSRNLGHAHDQTGMKRRRHPKKENDYEVPSGEDMSERERERQATSGPKEAAREPLAGVPGFSGSLQGAHS